MQPILVHCTPLVGLLSDLLGTYLTLAACPPKSSPLLYTCLHHRSSRATFATKLHGPSTYVLLTVPLGRLNFSMSNFVLFTRLTCS